MIRTIAVAAILGLGVTAVLAQSDPITERRNAMKAVGAATRDGAAIAKGEAPFEAAKAQAIAKAYVDSAPKIWEDQAGFKAAFAKFETDAAAIGTATDVASFRTAFGNATKNCGSCHEVYRIKK